MSPLVMRAVIAAALALSALVPNSALGAVANATGMVNAPVPEVLTVEVDRGRLSVEIREQPIGTVLREIAGQAGFELLMSPEVSAKTLSTKFSRVRLERAISRLMGLIDHKDYFVYYGPEGNISKIEVYGGTEGAVATAPRPAARPAPSPSPVPQPLPKIRPPSVRPPSPPLVIRPEEPPRVAPIEEEPEEIPEETIKEEEPFFTPSGVFFQIAPPPAEPTDPGDEVPRDDTVPEEPSEGNGGDGGDGDGGDYSEPEINPEGDVPDGYDLLDAPFVPPAGGPQIP